MERLEVMDAIYKNGWEDRRLSSSRHGQLEYYMTMQYIHKYIPAGKKVLEVGAGTGRYSVALAKEGYEVTAVELVKDNFDVLVSNSRGVEGITCYQGDALELNMFEDESFEAVLLLGPMYHLFEKSDAMQCLSEAVRVLKKDGVLLTAYLSIHALMVNNYLAKNFKKGLDFNFDESMSVKHFSMQGFTAYHITEMEQLYSKLPVEQLAIVGLDSVMETAERGPDFEMSDEDFEALCRYQLQFAEVREMLAGNAHVLHVCRKCA